ncbi:MAG: Omp28-related outer membrane protein [Ignavibacteriaceae bacterium]
MRILLYVLLTSLLIAQVCFGQYQKKVLIEDFTNSHCPLCPPAYSALYSFKDNDTNSVHASFIYYHMPFPYSDDPLYQANKSDPSARNNYYGPYSSTPDAFFDGVIQSHSYITWGKTLDGFIKGKTSPLQITLSGMAETGKIDLKSKISRSGDINQSDLVLHFVVVENIHYLGRNGVSRHDNVMRKMLPTPAGKPLSINDNETIEVDTTIDLDAGWIPDSLSVVVFVQSKGTKEVYQSETIKYSDLNIMTDVENNKEIPAKFYLAQNYPNPFNPSTNISYYIPEQSQVRINIYNILGMHIAELGNYIRSPGKYNLKWNAGNLPSGFYFLNIEAVSIKSKNRFHKTIKMILLK